MNFLGHGLRVLILAGGIGAQAETVAPSPGRLKVQPIPTTPAEEKAFPVPLPAHALTPASQNSAPVFQVIPGRNPVTSDPKAEPARAEYLLPDPGEKPPITPENANLNLPADLEIVTTDTGEKIVLPAGTYRQILQLPMDSPLMQATDQTRRNQALPVEVPKEKSRYAEPDVPAVWVRYESLEKIKIGESERRGGIDLPSRQGEGLGPRVWYAKSETADVGSSLFYFIFGGLGYSTANLAGWSAGNTREIPGNFEYRLIRR